ARRRASIPSTSLRQDIATGSATGPALCEVIGSDWQ
ncbi:MAG: hypothetical protein ACI91F_000555, partial [Candidatus Binatia bacterium]